MTRPRITLLLLTYNQLDWIQAAVAGALGQQCEPIEIVMSDDASDDGSWELLNELSASYHGPHQVKLRQNSSNLGIGEHYNQAVAACTGDLIVTAAGDDISLPNRVRELAAAWDTNGCRVDLLSSHLFDMAVDGTPLGVVEVDDLSLWSSADSWVRKRPRVVGAAHAFTRRLFDRFGSIAADVPYEDQIMALRASCMGGGLTLPRPLVYYRRGGVSSSTVTLDRKDRWQHLSVKHRRQLAVFRQVQNDLEMIARADLCGGVVRRKVQQSALMLELLTTRSWSERLNLIRTARHTGLVWALTQAVTAPWIDEP